VRDYVSIAPAREYTSIWRPSRQIVATHITPVVDQGSFRFRDDDGDETSSGATWLDSQAADVSIDCSAGDVVFRLRIAAAETAGGFTFNWSSNVEYRLNGGSWTVLSTSSGPVWSTTASQLTDQADTTDHGVTGTGSWYGATNGGQSEAITVGGLSVDFGGNDYVLFELGLVLKKASVADSDTVEFRLASADNAASADYPLLTVIKAAPSVVDDVLFMFGGI